MSLPIERMSRALRQRGVCRFLEMFQEAFPTTHLKDLVVDAVLPGRRIVVAGRTVVNFGSDSFLGLDQDRRVQQAIADSAVRWGTHNGGSRAFASVAPNVEAETRLARWLGTEAVLMYPSVTLANLGAIPGLVDRQDVIAYDSQAHNSIQEGVKIAKANGVRTFAFEHDDPTDLDRMLETARPYRHALVCVDGVYSMSGTLPPLRELEAVTRRHEGVLYVDDAHGTGVLGRRGRGSVLECLDNYDNVLVAGSLSKALSCLGGFVGCPASFQQLLKMRSNTYIFGGPVPPPYLDGLLAALDIVDSDEYDGLHGRLMANVSQLLHGAQRLGLTVLGGLTPIVSILVGDEAHTLQAGYYLFERGYYVQSVTFPAVPYHAGVLRVQVNANHPPDAVEGLIGALADLRTMIPMPAPSNSLAA